MPTASSEMTMGTPAPAFDLPDPKGRRHALKDFAQAQALLVVFMCNHCPYVKAIADRLAADAKTLQENGIGVIAVMSNDTVAYPADSFENMQKFAADNGFSFPYVIDETQEVAKAYGAVCTPDFFGYNAAGELQYRGRLDAVNPSRPATPETEKELLKAMLEVAKTGTTAAEQIPSMGCNIKWRAA